MSEWRRHSAIWCSFLRSHSYNRDFKHLTEETCKGTHERNDLTQVTHDLQMALLILITVRYDDTRARFRYRRMK